MNVPFVRSALQRKRLGDYLRTSARLRYELGSGKLTKREGPLHNRLRLGHRQLSHSNLLKNKQQPFYHFCGTAVLNVAHILKHCHYLHSVRQQHGITTLRDTLQWKTESTSKLFHYLKHVQIFNFL